MDSSLYLTRASKFVEADPVRGIPESGTEYSSYFVVVAPNTDEASKNFVDILVTIQDLKVGKREKQGN